MGFLLVRVLVLLLPLSMLVLPSAADPAVTVAAERQAEDSLPGWMLYHQE